MPPLSDKLQQLLRQLSESGRSKSESLIGEELTESGVLDRAALNAQIGTILEGASRTPALARVMEQHLDAFQDCVRDQDVPRAAKQVLTLLSIEVDDLRRAAILSLMVRLVGKRKFDPIAAYILEDQAARGIGQG